jgi:hypothetical protein
VPSGRPSTTGPCSGWPTPRSRHTSECSLWNVCCNLHSLVPTGSLYPAGNSTCSMLQPSSLQQLEVAVVYDH